MQEGRRRRLIVVLAALLLVGITAAAVNASGIFEDPAGKVDRWIVEDKSSDPSPVALVNVSLMSYETAAATADDELAVERHRRRGRVTHVHVKDRSSDPHRSRRTTARGAAIWCRTSST